ncbi:MAG: hypothetical protein EOO15_15795 [Chitinophagaceae bacterium]|nr:MAG: hypothetical protein EOO15_15795 [Chitinophagaceae bacterium]
MKKAFFAAIIAIACTASAFANPTPAVNEKVLKAFATTFVSAQDVRWSEYKGMVEANFTFNEIRTRVTYDNEGNALHTIRYYFEQQLPLNILTKVKSNYENYKVHGVTEVTTDDRTEYHIVLESATGWMFLQADNSGYMTEEKKMSKA